MRSHRLQPVLLLGLLAADAAAAAAVDADASSRGLRDPLVPDSDLDAAPAPAPDDDDEPPPPPPGINGSGGEESLIAMQFSPDPHAGRDRYEMIRNGELGLAALRIAPTSFGGGSYGGGVGGSSYENVHGEFCAYEYPSPGSSSGVAEDYDPARYPDFHAVASTSDHCGEHRYTLPLREVIATVNDWDSSSVGGSRTMKRLPVTGLLFHEGHAGAGLISNALSTFDTARVVSEHPALRDALSACDVNRNRYKVDDCSAEAQRELVRDVVTLLSRMPTSSSSNVEKLYLKLPSGSAAYLPELRSLYPDAPWLFAYRDPAHALAKATTHKRNAECVRARRNPSSALAAKVSSSGKGDIDLEKLSHHEVCALHLSTLLDAASNEHGTTGTGMILRYEDFVLDNPSSIVDDVLPYLGMGDEIESDTEGTRERVAKVLATKSSVVGVRNVDDRQWKEGGEEIEVSEEVGNAARSFMGDSMDSIARA